MSNAHFQSLSVGLIIVSTLIVGSVASAETPREALDAAIGEAQKTLAQIDFDGDAAAQRAKLAELFARIAKCEVNLLRDIKKALLNFLNGSDAIYGSLRGLMNKTGALTAREDFFREIAKRLFGGAIKKDLENEDSLGLFSSLENTLAQDWYPNRDASDVIKKMFDPLWDEALAGTAGKGEPWAAAVRQLALVRKLLAQMANIRVLHAKAYPAKSIPPSPAPGPTPTPPKVPAPPQSPAVLSPQMTPYILQALLRAASAAPSFTSARRGGASAEPAISRIPETIDELRAECLKGASANLGFISDGIQKFVAATPVECGNLTVRLFARSTASVGSELRLATRPVFQALSSLRNIMRVGLGAEFPKRVGRLTAAFNPEKLSQLSVARPDARPALAAVVSAAEPNGVTLGKDTFDALNKELENAIKQLDAQIRAKEAELAAASDAGVRSALERELRLLRFQRDTVRNTKEVKDAIHECRISRNDQGEFDPFLEFNRFRKAIADMILQTLEPIVAAMGSSDSTKRRIQSLADNVAIWGDGGTEKTGKPGTNRGTRIESLMDAYNDALPQRKLGGGIADIPLAFGGLIRELFDAVGVTDLFEQVGRVEDQLRAALVSKDRDNPSPAARLSRNICDYDAVLTDLRCVIPQLPGVGEASIEIEERVTRYITSREPGGDSPASIAEDLLKKILDEAATQAYALVQQALADARAEDEMVPALSPQEINIVLAAARNDALAAGNVRTFVRAFTDGMKQLLRSKKDDGIDRAFAINSNDADDVAARDRAVTTLKREYDVKIDTQVDAAAASAFADLVSKLDALLNDMQKDFPWKRSDFQTMTNLQEAAARAQAALERSLQAVQARVAALLAQGDEIDLWPFVDKIREAYKTGGDTPEARFAAVDKVIEELKAKLKAK